MCTCVTMSLGKGTGVQTTLVINMLCCFVLFLINNQIFVSTFLLVLLIVVAVLQ